MITYSHNGSESFIIYWFSLIILNGFQNIFSAKTTLTGNIFLKWSSKLVI